MAPTINVNKMMAWTGSPCATNSAALAATITEMALVGPSMTNSELPKVAPRTDAATAVERPAAGGNPAIRA